MDRDLEQGSRKLGDWNLEGRELRNWVRTKARYMSWMQYSTSYATKCTGGATVTHEIMNSEIRTALHNTMCVREKM